MEILIVDRISGGFAVCEDKHKKLHNIAIHLLPANTKAGSVLICQNGGYTLSESEEEKRRKRIKELEAKIFGE